MVTRFTASEARESSELAKQKIADEKKSLKAAEIAKAKELAAMDAGWKRQSEALLKAAIDGETFLRFDEKIFNFKQLINLGFIVYEEGQVQNISLTQQDEELDKNELRSARKLVAHAFNKFIEASEKSVADYFCGKELYRDDIYELVSDFMNGDYESDGQNIDGLLLIVMNDNPLLDGFDMRRFREEIDAIEVAIQAYRKIKTERKRKSVNSEVSDSDSDIEAVKSPPVLIREFGQYHFTKTDAETPVLVPSYEGNFFNVGWMTDNKNFFHNESIFSASGLSWLSGKYGQQLMASIFNFLRYATESGKKSAILKFEMFNAEGWFFVDARGMDIYSCVPDEIPSLIESDGFTVIDTTSTKSKYTITVSW